MRCVDRHGTAGFSISQVATDLGVIRQTVYRYFPSTDDLFAAVGQVAVEDLVDELTEHLRALDEPAEWFVEALASAVERLPDRPYLTLLLAAGRTDPFARGVTSEEAMAVGREMFTRSSVDWAAAGYGDAATDELIEVMLRLLQSMVIDPPNPPRRGAELRAWFDRWIAPSLR